MEPRIQYCRTSDGVSIAYWTMGEGPALVWMELPSHLQAERKQVPERQPMYEQVSRIAALVRYDHRGFGLSERDIFNFPLDAFVRDLEAVVDNLGLATFVLLASGGFTGPVAISYAAAHPERVSRLVLRLGIARIPPQYHWQVQALLLSSNDWRFVTESIFRLGLGWEREEESRKGAALMRETFTYDTFKAFWRDASQWDVRDLLPRVAMPALLIHIAEHIFAGPEQSREIASMMPDARAVIIDGTTSSERDAHYEAAIASFLLGSDAALREPAPVPGPHTTAVILFADIVDSTALSEQLGNAAFRDRSRALEEQIRKHVSAHSGRAVEGRTLGDGVLGTFASASDAIAAALACATAGAELALALHLGLHAGDVIREQGNVHGQAVSIAARVSDLSAPNEVLVSGTVRDLARASAGVSFEDRGERELKGVGEPVRVFAVRPEGR